MKKFYISLFICLSTALIVKANDIPNAGLGIILQKINNQILVKKVIQNSDMGINGLWGGDVITEIDGISTENLSLEEVKSKLKGAKGSKVTIKFLREEEYENFWGKKKTQFVPYQITLTRNYEIDSDFPVRVFKNGNQYNIKMNYQNQKLNCKTVYRKIKNQYNRELRCSDWNGQHLENTLNLPTEFWINLDNLIFTKYNEYALWHDSPASIVKNKNELIIAKTSTEIGKKACLEKGGKYSYDVVTGCTNCSYTLDWTKDMTKKEKEDYFRAKDFEEEYKNYLRHKWQYP